MNELCAEDSDQEWLFFQDNDEGILIPRGEYADLACWTCGKIDEIAALKRGVLNIVFDTDDDVVLSAEDWLCVSPKFVALYTQLGISGLEFIPTRGGFFAVLCTNVIEIDPTTAGFEELKRCAACERPQERIVGPMATSFGHIRDRDSFFTASIPNENVRAMHQRIFTSQRVSNAFPASQLAGLCFVEW